MSDEFSGPVEGGRSDDFAVPELPGWMAEEPETDYDAEGREHVLDGADVAAPDRFEQESGVPWLAVARRPEAPSTEEVACRAQDALIATAQFFALAEAHRIVALVTAYECSIEDLATRFGPVIGSRTGLGAQSFFTSMGLALRQHPRRVAHELDTALTVSKRMPRTWDVFLHGGTTWARVDAAAAGADGLDDEHWAAYDDAAARLVVRSSRLKHDLRVEREKLQADTAARRARATFDRRTTALELGHDGEASLVITGPVAALMACNDALHAAAVAAHGVAGETRGIGQLRHDIAVDLLVDGLRLPADPDPRPATAGTGAGAAAGTRRVPARKAVEVQLILTVPALAWLGRTTEQALLGGYGPIAMEVAKDLAADATSFTRVLTDPVTGVRLTMDRRTYRPPADLDRWVRIRDGRSRFPGTNTPAHLADIDHAREWQHGGPTDAGNLVTLSRPAHLLKSAGLYREEVLDAGIIGWTDAWLRYFDDPPHEPLDPAPPHLLPPPPDPHDDPAPF